MAFELDAIVRDAVALANDVSASLQDTVALQRWTGQSGTGTPSYAASINVSAIVEQKQRMRALANGQTIMTRAKITILTPLSAQGAAGRTEPIDTRDKFTLPDGTTGPIVDVEGLNDPDTNRPFFAEVWLGLGGASGGGR